MLLGIVASLLLSRTPNLYEYGPYTSGIPRPDAVLDYTIGSRHTTYHDQDRTLEKIASSATPVIKRFNYGKSVEGRPLRVYAISSPENIKHLEEIRKAHEKVANGEPADTVPIVWINECIHGDETASFEAAMPLIYNLTASKPLQDVLKDVVVIVNPCYNVDGHERYVVYYNSIATGTPDNGAFENQEPALLYGRLNHYRFDMNRDRVAMSQDETRQEVEEFLRWNPQVYCDQHGQVSSYFFPPNPMAVNENVDRPRVAKWTDVFGRATANAFDQHGWTYYTKNEFDLFYAGYLDSWTTLTGAVGMTHETDGGRVLASTRQDGSVLTLLDGLAHHMTSAIAVIKSAAAHRHDLMDSYAAFKRHAVAGDFSPKVKRYVITGDDRALGRLQRVLNSSGIGVMAGLTSYDQPGARRFGTSEYKTAHIEGHFLAVDLAQAQGPMAKALLEETPAFEAQFVKEQLAKKGSAPEGEEYPGPDGTEFYDITGWSLPLAWGLTAYECTATVSIPSKTEPKGDMSGGPKVGLAIPYLDDEDALAAFEIEAAGVKGMLSSRPMQLGNRKFAAHSFMFLAARNDDGFEDTVRLIATRHASQIVAIPTSYPDQDRFGPGSDFTIPLKKPNIGIVFGTAEQPTEFSAIWYLFDREFRLPYTSLQNRALSQGNLAKYTTIILPGRFTGGSDALKAWVQAGGTLVCLDNASWASSNFQRLDNSEAKSRELPGALFRANLDPRSFLSAGYSPDEKGKIELAVPVDGSSFYKARKEGGSVISFDSNEKSRKLLSGWDWPEETDKALAGTVWLQDMPAGQGHVIVFTHDPTERAMWPGLYKLVLNAILIGPGT